MPEADAESAWTSARIRFISESCQPLALFWPPPPPPPPPRNGCCRLPGVAGTNSSRREARLRFVRSMMSCSVRGDGATPCMLGNAFKRLCCTTVPPCARPQASFTCTINQK